MRPVGFGVGATVPPAAGENDGLAVLVPAPPHAAITAVAPASLRNVRRSSSGVMLPNPPTRCVAKEHTRARPALGSSLTVMVWLQGGLTLRLVGATLPFIRYVVRPATSVAV